MADWGMPAFLLQMIGGLQSARQGREALKYWQDTSGEAQQRADDWWRDLMAGTGDFTGLKDTIKQYTTENQDLEELIRGGASSVEGRGRRLYQGLASKAPAEFKSLMAGLDNRFGGQLAQATGDIEGLTGRMRGEFAKAKAGATADVDRLRSDLLRAVEGSGEAQRLGIERRYREGKGQTAAALARRGLGGSVAATSGAALEPYRGEELANLEENLLQRRTGIIGDTGQMGIGLRSGYDTGLLGSLQGLGTLGAGMRNDITSNRLGAGERGISGYSDLYSRLGLAATQGQIDLGQWNLATQTGAREMSLANRLALQQMPYQAGQQALNTRLSTMLDWGLPPEYTPAASYAGQAAQQFHIAQVMKPPDPPSNPFSFGLSI